MSSGTDNKRSSPFDRMLDESRSQFDALLRRPKPERVVSRSSEPSQAAAPAARSATAERPLPASSSTPPPTAAKPQTPVGQPAAMEPLDIRATDLGRALASRLGDTWRFDVVDKRRDGEDFVVWGRLVVEDRGYDKTRRGRARIQRLGRSGGATSVSASAGGIDLTLRVPVVEQAEQAAYEEAVTAALGACARGL